MMPVKKNILFTFDYELFLGESSGSVLKCMIEPTEKLIAIFDSFQVKHAIFFVDTIYLIRLKEIAKSSAAAKGDYELISKQLQLLIQKGHYIFPHIHPHWADATYNALKNNWVLSSLQKYRFHSISEAEREYQFDQSIKILKEIIQPVNPNYAIDGYRAGGWCIQPFSDFYSHFKKHGIKYDFSVLPGLENKSDAQYYDFEKAPLASIYPFEIDVLLEDLSGSFTQIAISVIPIPKLYQLINKLFNKYLWKTGNRSSGDGIGVVASSFNSSPNKSNKEMVSLELLNSVKLPLYKRFLKENKLIHFISHPKMLTKHNFACLQHFLNFAKAQGFIENDFRKMLE